VSSGFDQPQVVVTHPVHQHAYQTALAAQRAGLLDAFWTGIYRTGRGLTSERVLRHLPARLRAAAESELSRRSEPGLDPARVRSLARYDAVSAIWRRTAKRVPLGGWDPDPWMLRRFDAAVAAFLRGRPPALVHAFEGAALSTFTAVRDSGGITVLDCPSAHERFIAVRRAAGDRRHHPTERIRAERGLADRLLAPSDQVVECLLENGVPAERIVRLPYGVDPQPLTDRERANRPFRVLFAGTIEPRKGIPELLAAWRRAALPEAELVLVGPQGQRARELLRELPSGARWQGGVPRREMVGWYRECDVFAFPSRAEGSAFVTYEAMAAGLPSVVSAEAGSVVRDGRDGFVVPAGDPARLAERLRELHDQPRLRAAMGSSARRAIEERFTSWHYRQRVTAVWNDLLGQAQS
jgi:glycosyltransferase involved in cell wall biosynthesis